jgi:hypothetical membrane protein
VLRGFCAIDRIHRDYSWLALSGIASPIILAAATVGVASGRPEYSHVRQTLSELGAQDAPGWLWMNIGGIIPAGGLVSVSALPLYRAFGKGLQSQAGCCALAVSGFCFVVAGLFPLTDGPGDTVTASTGIHLTAAIAGFCGLGLSPFLFALHARRHESVHGWFIPSLLAASGVFLFSAAIAIGAPGAYQRAALVTFYSWLIAGSAWAFKRARDRTRR